MKKPIVFALAGILLLGSMSSPSSFGVAAGKEKRKTVQTGELVPARAIEVFEYVIKTGKAPQGYVGGRVWQNREGRLPKDGDYREYDVNPKVRGKNRGAERIIVDMRTMRGWYTADHYRTFKPIRR